MATRAIGAEAALVDLRLCMAGDTLLDRALEGIVRMTQLALKNSMFAGELESGMLMVETGHIRKSGLGPFVLGVALPALLHVRYRAMHRCVSLDLLANIRVAANAA